MTTKLSIRGGGTLPGGKPPYDDSLHRCGAGQEPTVDEVAFRATWSNGRPSG